jgi:hypothetical protein
MATLSCTNCSKIITTSSYRAKRHSGFCGDCNRRRPKNLKEPYRWLYNLLRTQAAKREIEVSLSFEEFVSLTDIECCRYCNGPITWQKHSNKRNARTNLDRKDNTKNYSIDNVAVCCADCNTRKSNWLSDDEFQLVNDLLRLYRSASEYEKKEIAYCVLTLGDQLESNNPD